MKTFKLLPEVKDFIICQKKADPSLSCRSISQLISQKLNKKISKSLVNYILKNQGLSAKIGRPSKAKTSQGISYDVDCAGAYFLTGTDEQLSLSVILRQFIRNVFPHSNSKVLERKNRIAFYWPIFRPNDESLEKLNLYSGTGLWLAASEGQRIVKSSVIKYLDKIDSLDIVHNILQGIELGIEFVNLIVFNLKNGKKFYIDPTFHLTWLEPKSPHVYNMPIIKTEEALKKVLFTNEPLILLSSRPYQPIQPDLAQFFASWLNIGDNSIKSVSLLDAAGVEISRIDKVALRRRDFIFGALPWQLAELRFPVEKQVTPTAKIGPSQQEFILESVEIKFAQLVDIKEVKLRVIFLKNASNQPRLCLITNIPTNEKADLEIARLYLMRWPNLEEGFEDMLHNIEVIKFPQLANDYKSIDSNKLRIKFPQQKLSFSGLLNILLEYLNTICQLRYFSGNSSLKLAEMKQRFYSLPGKIVQTQDLTVVTLFYPPNYPYLANLKYACCRFNEDNVRLKNKPIVISFQKR
jgi:hypothetical protein